MYDTKTEDDTLILSELDCVQDTEPTLEELDEAADYFEHTVSPSGDKVWTVTAEERAKVSLGEPVLTGGSSASGTTDEVPEDSPTTVKARVEVIEKSIGLGRKSKPRDTPKPEDILPGDPKWERIGDRVIRIYKNTNKPEGVWPEVWQRTSHKER